MNTKEIEKDIRSRIKERCTIEVVKDDDYTTAIAKITINGDKYSNAVKWENNDQYDPNNTYGFFEVAMVLECWITEKKDELQKTERLNLVLSKNDMANLKENANGNVSEYIRERCCQKVLDN